MKLNGKYLEIMLAKGVKRLEKILKKLESNKITNSTLFVRNVPPDSTEAEILGIFKNCGEIKAIRLPLKQDDPTKKNGLCFIDFTAKVSIKKAFELDGYMLRGWNLKLDIDATFNEHAQSKVGVTIKPKKDADSSFIETCPSPYRGPREAPNLNPFNMTPNNQYSGHPQPQCPPQYHREMQHPNQHPEYMNQCYYNSYAF